MIAEKGEKVMKVYQRSLSKILATLICIATIMISFMSRVYATEEGGGSEIEGPPTEPGIVDVLQPDSRN